MAEDRDKKSPQTASRTDDERRERLASQLRANLKRRKQQARMRRDPATRAGGAAETDTTDDKR